MLSPLLKPTIHTKQGPAWRRMSDANTLCNACTLACNQVYAKYFNICLIICNPTYVVSISEYCLRTASSMSSSGNAHMKMLWQRMLTSHISTYIGYIQYYIVQDNQHYAKCLNCCTYVSANIPTLSCGRRENSLGDYDLALGQQVTIRSTL